MVSLEWNSNEYYESFRVFVLVQDFVESGSWCRTDRNTTTNRADDREK